MMSRAWLLWVLSQFEKDGSARTEKELLQGCDPLLRMWCKRRLAQLLYRAELLSGCSDERHVARLASFQLVGHAPSSPFDDIAAVAREYADVVGQVAQPRRGPFLSGLLAMLMLGGIVSWNVASDMLAPFSPAQTDLGAWMEREMTQLAMQVSKGQAVSARQLAQSVGDVTADSALVGAMARLTDAALAARGNVKAGQDAYLGATLQLNRELERAGQPYFIDGDFYPLADTMSPILLSFYVQSRGQYAAAQSGVDERNIDVLWLWRLDRLNVLQSKLGYTRANIPYAVVLLDRVEDDLVTQVLPAVSPSEPMSLTDQDTELSAEDWVAELQRQGASLIRRHYAESPAAVREQAMRLGKLLARRRSLLSRWKKTLGRSHEELRMPTRLVPEADYSAELALRIPRDELRAWDELHDELLQPQSIRGFEQVRLPYLCSVERHEVQHRIDYRAERFTIPELLAKRMGLAETVGFDTHSLPNKASMELSAYLAQIADQGPLLALVTMSRTFFSQHSRGGPHSYAALVAIEAIAQELGVDVDARLGRRVSRRQLAALLADVGQFPSKKIQEAAQRAYVALFAEELSKVKRLPFSESPNWRH